MVRGRPKEFVREEALESALEAFWEHGYAGTALSDLTETMGIGRQSLYDTFGDKHSLFLQALQGYCDRQIDALNGMLHGENAAAERLVAFIDQWSVMLSGPMARGCMALKSCTEFSGSEDCEVTELLKSMVQRFETTLTGCVQEAMDDGDLRTDCSARELARLIQSTAQGLNTRANLGDAAAVTREASSALKTLLGL